jgi:hypothetical protein
MEFTAKPVSKGQLTETRKVVILPVSRLAEFLLDDGHSVGF